MADRAPPGEQRWNRSISHRYTTLNMLTEQADHLLRRNYAAEHWSIDALKLQCARQAAMIEALAGKNARQRLELRRLNRALARKARAKKDRPDV